MRCISCVIFILIIILWVEYMGSFPQKDNITSTRNRNVTLALKCMAN